MMHVQPSDNLMNAYSTKSAQEAQQRKVTGADAVVTELGKDFAAVVQQALQEHQSDQQLVEQAKADLLAGTLDSPEAIESAADNMLSYGI